MLRTDTLVITFWVSAESRHFNCSPDYWCAPAAPTSTWGNRGEGKCVFLMALPPVTLLNAREPREKARHT